MRQISITLAETAHWHALIGKAEHTSKHILPQGIEDYLVRLFMRVEQEETPAHMQNSDYLKEVSSNNKLQLLGDKCLMLCGFYPEAGEDYGISIDEFISRGVAAYKKLTSIEHDENEMIFEYLAQNFVQVSQLLNHMSFYSEQPAKRKIHETIEDYVASDISSEKMVVSVDLHWFVSSISWKWSLPSSY